MVLISQPPGGQCHDLFHGADQYGGFGTPSHNRVLKPPGGGSSNIFGPPDENSPARGGRPNRMASSIPIGEVPEAPAPQSNGSSTPSTPTKPGSPNPVTGEGYEEVEKKEPSPPPAQPKKRVPPGGYSTPLW